MTLKLNGSSSGSVSIDAPASTTSGADITFKLPVADGTANQVVKTDASGNLAFQAPGAYVKLATVANTSAQASISHDVFDSNLYSAYHFIGAMKPATDGTHLYFRWRASSADLTVSTYDYGQMYTYPNDQYYSESDDDQNRMELIQNAGNSTREGWRLNMWMYPLTTGTLGNYCTWSGCRLDENNKIRTVQGSGIYDATTQPTGFSIYPSTGDFAEIRYSLYGLRI